MPDGPCRVAHRHRNYGVMRIGPPLARLSLATRFALLSAGVLVVGALVLGTWVANVIESSVLHRVAADSALYVEALLEEHVPSLAAGTLGPAERDELSGHLERANARRVA